MRACLDKLRPSRGIYFFVLLQLISQFGYDCQQEHHKPWPYSSSEISLAPINPYSISRFCGRWSHFRQVILKALVFALPTLTRALRPGIIKALHFCSKAALSHMAGVCVGALLSFWLASLFRGKMIILLMQGMFYKHINMLSCYLFNSLLLLVQCFITKVSGRG